MVLIGGVLIVGGFLLFAVPALLMGDLGSIGWCGLLLVGVGVALVVRGVIASRRARARHAEAVRAGIAAGWIRCSACNGEGRVIVGALPSHHGNAGLIYAPCGACAGQGWFAPPQPGRPPGL
jgi:hypothetical protein